MKSILYFENLFQFRYDNFYLNDGRNGWDQYYGVYPFGDGSIDYIFNPVRTPDDFIYIQFVSDNSVNKKGWLINYRIGKLPFLFEIHKDGPYEFY